jgi:HNH endonuclease
MSLVQTFIQYGVPSNWAAAYAVSGLSVATFKVTSKKHLAERYKIPVEQISFVKDCLQRKPIEEKIVQQLLEKSNFICCLCKGTKSDAFIIHHITEYSKTQDNQYTNLAVLCPNDHDLAHREGVALTNKISEAQIRQAKTSWEKQVKKDNKKASFVKPSVSSVKDWKSFHPYKELQSYTEGDKDYFFGRTEEIEILLTKIIRYNIIGLFGESGTGKTSLVNAGLLPNFKDQSFITVSVRCIDEPIKRIREELSKQIKEKITSYEMNELILADSFAHLIVSLKKLIEKYDLKIIIIIDQFEELFTRASETERKNLSKGIVEAISSPSVTGKLFFLLSLREDYLGDLWDWSHVYKLEDAWIHQYRISRFTEIKAREVIVRPLEQLGIPFNIGFIDGIIQQLKIAGDGWIYPPYLQILCSVLTDRYKRINTGNKPVLVFDDSLLEDDLSVESVITDYLSESMLEGLTKEEQDAAKNILDLLTGPQGLRDFLTLEEIARNISYAQSDALHVIEHLIKRKIVHPLIEDDKVTGYELVHDFLSKKFFERLSADEKKKKTVRDIFKKAFGEWKQHDVLASLDRMEILYQSHDQLILNKEEWIFLLKSSFSVYWYWNSNKWLKVIDKPLLFTISMELLNDKEERIVQSACSALTRLENPACLPAMIQLLESNATSTGIKDTILHHLGFYMRDERSIPVIKHIALHNAEVKLRKNAIYAFGQIIRELAKTDGGIIEKEIEMPLAALNDSMTQVRKTAIDVLSGTFITKKTVTALLALLRTESSITSRKALVYALGLQIRKDDKFWSIISPIIKHISKSDKEDYRVKQEAIDAFKRREEYFRHLKLASQVK